MKPLLSATVVTMMMLGVPALAQTATDAPADPQATLASEAPAAAPAVEPAPATETVDTGAAGVGAAGTEAADSETADSEATGTTSAATVAEAAPADEPMFITQQPGNALFSSDLVGYAVYGTAGEKIGDINDILIDDEGAVVAVIIGVGGFLGINEKDVAVPLSRLEVERVNEEYRISIAATEDELTSAPGFMRADGTSSDRLGAFERAYTRNKARAEEALETVSQRASELSEEAKREASELSERAKTEARGLVERGRKAIHELTADDEETTPADAN